MNSEVPRGTLLPAKCGAEKARSAFHSFNLLGPAIYVGVHDLDLVLASRTPENNEPRLLGQSSNALGPRASRAVSQGFPQESRERLGSTFSHLTLSRRCRGHWRRSCRMRSLSSFRAHRCSDSPRHSFVRQSRSMQLQSILRGHWQRDDDARD